MHAVLTIDHDGAVGKIPAESATSFFLRDSLMFGMANRHFGAKFAVNVPMESGNLSAPSQMLTLMAFL